MRMQPEVYIQMPFRVTFICPMDDIPVCRLQIVLVANPAHIEARDL
jgi:hypothetical protein